jgi:hypothetical protein
MRRIALMSVVLLVVMWLVLPINMAFAAAPRAVQLGQPAKELSAEWWQWVWSIPGSVNPLLDATGDFCAVGQRGDVWFLAGNFGGTTVRTCIVPEGKTLFFPVVNLGPFDSPNQCGQGPESLGSVKDMRALAAASIDGATNLSVTLDGERVKQTQRVKSEVFEVSMPPDNVFVFLGITPCDPGVYSPAVDDGYYVHIKPLETGSHTLHIHAELPDSAFVLDVTYNLTVVPITLK